MKKIMLLIILGGGYYAYDNGTFPFGGSRGAYDENGDPAVWIFTFDQCEKTTDIVAKYFDKTDLEYEVFDVSANDDNLARARKITPRIGCPTVAIGSTITQVDTLVGRDGQIAYEQTRREARVILDTALVENFGPRYLSSRHKKIFDKHFYEDNGAPKVVIYGTPTCAYCQATKKLFDQYKIEYDDRNIESSDSAMNAFTLLNGNGTPLTYVGYNRFIGYDANGYQDIINKLQKNEVAYKNH